MDIVLVIGRVLFAYLFLRSGVQHLRDRKILEGYAQAKGVPYPALAIPLTGVMLLVGAISVAFGFYADFGALLLILFLVPTTVLMHNFWTVEDPQARQADEVHFYKDVALLGAAVVIFWLYNQGQDVPASLTHALFSVF